MLQAVPDIIFGIFLVFLAMVLVVFVVAAMALRRRPLHKPIETGIVFIEGLPGSGKSFAAVEELVRVILEDKRQVYTNLPIKDRVLRKYLTRKAGEDAYANLYVPLSREHWDAFLERAQRVSDTREQWSAELDALGVKHRSDADFLKWYEDKTGDKPISRGKGANWIPTGAEIILDEAHKWAPQTGAQRNTSLLGYTSMHRHFYHRIICITQNPMNVAIEFRRMAKTYIRVDNFGSLPIIGPITLNWLGLGGNFARYCYYSPESYKNAADTGGVMGRPDRTRITWFRLRRHIWKLYNSNVHAGTSERQQRKLSEKIRHEAGVDLPENTKPEPRRLKRRPVRAAARVVFTAGLVFVALISGVAIGRDSSNVPVSTPEEPGNEGGSTDALDSPPVLTNLGDTWARLDGKRVQLSSSIGSWLLFAISRDDAYAVVLPRDATSRDAWLLVPGRDPESLGPADRLLAQLRDEARRKFVADTNGGSLTEAVAPGS